MPSKYDLIVIGAGPGGYEAAVTAARRGMKVLLTEREQPGGTCLNRGCIPTKALLHAGQALRGARECGGMGLDVEARGVDPAGVWAYMGGVMDKLRAGMEAGIRAAGIDYITGSALVEGPGRVRIGEESYETKYIIVAVGARPVMLPVEGAGLPGVVTSDGLLSSPDTLNGSLAIVGGGVIGCEFAAAWAYFGQKAVIIEAAPRILPGFDKEISQSIAMSLKRRGVEIHTSSMLKSIKEAGGELLCEFDAGGKLDSAPAKTVLIAVGRKPDTAGLVAPNAGVVTGRSGGIVVDGSFKSSAEGIYAIGDCVEGGVQLAHAAAAQGICAVDAICGLPASVNLGVIPSCVYAGIEAASVGLDAARAEEAGIEAVTGKYVMTYNGRSLIEGGERGFVKVVARKGDGVLIGAQILCERAGDMIGELALAVSSGATVGSLLSVVRAHPSFYEGVTGALEAAREKL